MEKNNDRATKIWFEIKDLLAGTAFPFMMMLILNVSFIGMASALSSDLGLQIAMLVIGEALMGVAYYIFGRQSGVVSVRKLVQHAKKRDIGTTDKQALFGTGEYSAYKGFLIGFLSCVPYIIVQLIECCIHNDFCWFLLQYVFGWAAYPFYFAKMSPWLNFVFIVYPVLVHGIAYIIGGNKEWTKQQKVAELQRDKDGNKDK